MVYSVKGFRQVDKYTDTIISLIKVLNNFILVLEL